MNPFTDFFLKITFYFIIITINLDTLKMYKMLQVCRIIRNKL